MPQFGKTSLSNLSECHPDLQLICKEALKVGFDFSVIEGYRGEEEQNRAFNSGKSKLRFPQSKHNLSPSHAVDLLPYQSWREDKSKVWGDTKAFAVLAGIMLSTAERLYEEGRIKFRLRWGGDWNRNWNFEDQSFHDLPHFELIT